VGAGSTGNVPVAVNDTVAMSEDCSITPATTCATPLVITPWANDTLNGVLILAANNPAVTIVQAPTKGTAVPGAGGTVNYTPASNTNGVDSFTYRVSVNGVASNIASVQVTVAPVNDAPTANNDSAVAIVGATAQLAVLSNDSDPDGAATITAAVIVAGNASLGVAAGAVFNGTVSVTPTAAGPQTFTYRARDAAGALSPNTATVTVNVGATETVTIQIAEYRTVPRRLRVSGTISPTNTGSVTIRTFNASTPGTTTFTGTAQIVGGTWAFDQSGLSIGNANRVTVTGPGNGSNTATLLLRR
jgi:hypothetical protein